MHRFYVRGYAGTHNLGDAVQTYALCRLLPGDVRAWPGDAKADGRPFVVNGWLGYPPAPVRPAVHAGVFVSRRGGSEPAAYLSWLARSTTPVGTRDPHTAGLLMRAGVRQTLVGCATLTLPRYAGPRHGTLRIDDGPRQVPMLAPSATNLLPADMPWRMQWRLALHRIGEMRRAAVVVTRRLHVVLPCLAMGTPVRWVADGDEADARFSVMAAVGLPLSGECDRFDADPWRERFAAHLTAVTGAPATDREPEIPMP